MSQRLGDAEIKKKGFPRAPKCPVCGNNSLSYEVHDGSSGVVWLKAICRCRCEFLWNSSKRIWFRVEPAKIQVVE